MMGLEDDSGFLLGPFENFRRLLLLNFQGVDLNLRKGDSSLSVVKGRYKLARIS